jgi:hypothetical protein
MSDNPRMTVFIRAHAAYLKYFSRGMSNRMLKPTTLLMILTFTAFDVGAQSPKSDIDGLEKHLNQKMVGPEAVQVIKRHLLESGTSEPLDELVTWAKEGFPDLHDEHGIWKTEALALRLGVVWSIHYYFSTSPPDNKSQSYLKILSELQRDDYMSYQLTGMASSVVDEAVLEAEVLKLLDDKDARLRSQGVMMGAALAKQKRSLFERYIQMVKTDDNAQVRVTILYSLGSWRSKEVAYIGLERLVNDSDPDVRDWGARVLRGSAQFRVLTEEDLPAILAPMIKTSTPFVRISLGRVAARLTTGRSLWIQEDKITDELLAGFIQRTRLSESEAGVSPSEEELAKLWLEWWTPLIPKYARRIQLVR